MKEVRSAYTGKAPRWQPYFQYGNNIPLPSTRLASVDAFRAVTMFLMIFVNDLWSLVNVPHWLGHAPEHEWGLGMADTIFPAFLFIVGLSIPFATEARQAKGISKGRTFLHILGRSFSLLLMGFFLVNLEEYDKAASLLPRAWWQIGVVIGFFLVWCNYPARISKKGKLALHITGILLLAGMAALFRGDNYNHYAWMRPGWYGILGLIGWSYLVCAIIYLFAGKRLWLLLTAFGVFIFFNLSNQMGWFGFVDYIAHHVDNGALPAFTMAGILTATLYRRLIQEGLPGQGIMVLSTFALILMAAGLVSRSFWGISKAEETPSYALICMALALAAFVVMIYIVDIKGRQQWVKPILPAGTSALTCFLLPTIHYGILNLFNNHYSLPLFLRTGNIGILKSMLYSLLIIRIAAWLEKKGFKLSL